MLLFTYLFVFSAACVCCSARVFPVEYNCDTSCSSYTCVTNKTLCQLNTYLRQCGCCHLCVRGNLELCGGLFGRYGVCGKGLRCTVSEKAVLRGEFTGVGICRPLECLRRCRRKRVSPVCGSDGLVYKNICEMKRYACLKGLHITNRPLSHCVNTRHCRGRESCDFVMLFNKNGNVNRSWRQAYRCEGMQACSLQSTNIPWCASNGRSYPSKCEINIHSCITHDQLIASYQGRCSTSGGESVGHILLPLDTHTQPIVTGSPQSELVYNSSDPYST